MSEHDAVVVGGGLVGASTAYHLARNGTETLLIDREDEGRATDAGAGIVFPATSSRSASPTWFAFALEAADYYPELAAALDGDDHGYARTGLLSVAVDPDEVDDYLEEKRRTERRTAERGRPRADRTAEISAERARELYPPLADAERVTHYADGARVDGRAFTAALCETGRSLGVTTERGDVTGIRVENGSVRGVTTAAGDAYDADAVVIAGGAWSPRFGADLGVDVPVEPQRGQILHLDVGPLDAPRPSGEWPIVKAFRHQYQVPWPDGRVACGATRETGSGFAPSVTLEGLREVSTEALRVAPGLADARHVETRVGLRPASPDGLPILGPVPSVEGAFLATGHGPTGLTLGPYSGKLVADAVRGVEPETDLKPFRVDRFGE
ncbi:FAD-dependent oxidoreductase [Halorubrum sp. JWXQ-INN 858]|uniref:NAD(P)/FAD-dependent oxidoreductase n=1 Tax=Halorubrum sp. JWXQ-INN 858 TaxID=2690782 RepID=UPI00135BB7DC|nr:FAD-dependent oxidoreductase [Halorubrum sp. JWXQ-INN 858]MWV63694.1 FAD-dependent oxidoreductase [Halorubrum sp. JWXQ-INN 858]